MSHWLYRIAFELKGIARLSLYDKLRTLLAYPWEVVYQGRYLFLILGLYLIYRYTRKR